MGVDEEDEVQTFGLLVRRGDGCRPHRVVGGRATWLFAVAAFLVIGIQGSAPAHANGLGAWVVAEIAGDVAVRSGDTAWRRVGRGQQLVPGTTLKTGANGRATITRNGDVIEVSPISVVALPIGKGGEASPGVVQSLGTLLYKILTREQKQAKFSVKTPYLAAVIKGTTFTVTVNDQGSALHVTEGIVQVTSPFTGETALIRPGQTGMVSATGNRGLKVRRAGQKRSSTDTDQSSSSTAQNRGNSDDTANGNRENVRGKRIGQRLGAKRIDIGEVTEGLVEDGAAAGNARGNTPAGKAKGLSNANVPGISSGAVAVAGVPNGNGNGNGNAAGGPSPNGVAVGLTGAQPPGLALGLNKNGNNGKGKGKNK